ncbi:MAG: ABC-F family ATP-binding cassette domain-containing protein [Clostridia bacterium]|nr:ABC-F family ATP-binding cassette domain-containing protein [Clostridia bacterium]
MIIYSCKNASVSFGGETILENLNITVNEKDRIGIIGPNGAGKTTFIKMLLGINQPESGEVYSTSRFSYGYLTQNSSLDSDSTVMQEFLKSFSDLIELEKEIATCENMLSAASHDEAIALSQKLSGLYEKHVNGGGNTYRSRIIGILKGLKFPEESFDLTISSLSGGQKTRLALGQIILSQPDIMILDEPTNHLDTESIEWLESELKSFNGTLIVISHDRYFLENTVSKTLIIEHNTAKLYNAPYSKYIELRKADTEYQQRCYIQQQKEIARIEGIIENQRKWNREKNIVTAESWQKKLDKMVLIDKPEADYTPPSINFDVETPGGENVLEIKNLGFAFPDKELFKDLNLNLFRGEHAFIKGPNGCGKSTLLKIITGHINDYAGSYKYGHNIKWSYYSQDFSDLNSENTVIDEVFEYANKRYFVEHAGKSYFHDILEIRNALAAFGFTGDDVFKKISVLSGGEKARVALLKISYDNASLLILDEPTNHLDIQSREALEEALLRFEGTIIAVSHDRYFVSKIAKQFIDMAATSAKQAVHELKKSTVSEPSEAKTSYLQAKEEKAKKRKLETLFNKLEIQITETEDELSKIDTQLADPAISSDFSKLSELTAERETLSDKLDKLTEQYFGVSEELEKL